MFKYFLILPFSYDNKDLYLTIFYFCASLNIIIFSIIFYSIVKFIRKEYHIRILLIILQQILPLISNTFFQPMFFIFMSTFDCTEEKTSIYSKNLKCYTPIYYINNVISIINLITFVPISLLSVTIFYEYSLGGEKNILSKKNSIPDVFFLCEKILITIIFVTIKKGFEIHYFLVITLVSFSLILVYLNFRYSRYNEELLNFLHKFLSITFFWASTCLLIGKITMNSKFDSCLGLFFVSEPIFFIILFLKRRNIRHFLSKIGKDESLEATIEHIHNYLYLLDKKKEERQAELILISYIQIYESSCIIKDCPLKRYLKLLDSGIEANGCLLQHANILFNFGISKFPDSIEIKFVYSLFLLKKLRRRKRAAEFLTNIQSLSPNIEEQFIIYRFNKMFEDNLSDLEEEEEGENIDIVKELKYRNFFKDFMGLIKEASSLYIDFWSQLLISSNNENENISQLNMCGTKINRVVKEIDYLYSKMKRLKSNNINCIRIYYDFISQILCDKKKTSQFKKILSELQEEHRIRILPEFKNININMLNKSDHYQYIVVHSQPENLGIIKNASLSISEIFGYEINDIIGQPIDILIPDNFQEEHSKILKKKLFHYKKKHFDLEIKSSLEIKEINSFAKTKSKYLIEINMKVILYTTEYNEQYFIASFSRESSFVHTNNEHNKKQTCYILTDNHLIIKYFTPNSPLFLGITSDVINNNIEITYYIKEIYQDFLKIAFETGELTSIQKLNLKKKIIAKNYSNATLINWRKNNFVEEFSKMNDVKRTKTHNKIFNREKSVPEQVFYLTVNEEIINGKVVGYIFKLEKPNFNEIKSSALINYRKTKGKLSSTIAKNHNISFPSEQLNISPDFIPVSKKNVKLEVNTFKLKLSDTKNNDLADYVKDKFILKFEGDQKSKKVQIEEEEEEDEEDEDMNESSSFDVHFPKIKKKITVRKSILQNIIAETKSLDEYYKVNLNNIKLYKYNYYRNAIDEFNFDKKSQVEKIINEVLHNNNPDKDDSEAKDLKKSRIEIMSNLNQSKDNEDEFVIQQIESALEKEEEQESISSFIYRSILTFLTLITMTVIAMVYILNSIKIIKKCSILILNSGNLMGLNGEGIFYIRELTLLNNENYTSYPSKLNKNDYTKLITSNLLDLFLIFDNYISEDISIKINYYKETKYEISEKEYKIENIKNDFTVVDTTNNLNSALIDISMDIFNICNKILTEVVSTDYEVFHFLKNSLNSIGKAFYIQIEVYIKELKNQIKTITIYCSIGFTIIILFIVFIYFSLQNAYYLVSEKKENYIEIFFEINPELIKNAIDRCENYLKKLTGKDLIEYNEIEEKDDFLEHLYNQYNSKFTDKNLKRKKRAKALAKKLLMKLLFFLFLLSIYYSITLFFFLSFLNQSIINYKFFQQQCIIENEYHLIFNSIREAYFDRNTHIFNINVKDYIQTELQDLYVIRRKANEYMDKYRKKIPGKYYEKYQNLSSLKPCDFRLNDYFIDENECKNFMNNATNYGVDLTTSYFVEEVRFAEQLRRASIKNNTKVNNLTLMGTIMYNQSWPSDENELKQYILNDPINYFNNGILRNVSIFYRNFILTLYNDIRNINKMSIDDYLNDINFRFILLFSLYITILSFIFLFYWLPFVRNLNNVLYKTKNLLSIIPKEVIMNISGIYALFGIENKKVDKSDGNEKKANNKR